MDDPMAQIMEDLPDAKWYVSLGDGTFAEIDERPYVFLATDQQIHVIDDNGGEAPIDCTNNGANEHEAWRWADGSDPDVPKQKPLPLMETHIHIKDLLEHSDWLQECTIL